MSVIMQINPFEFFVDTGGTALDSGYIWVGEANKYSPSFPVTAYYDEAMTIPAAMPLRTSNGYVVRNGSPTLLYINGNYSILVQDKTRRQVYYVADFLLTGSSSAAPMSAVTLNAPDGTASTVKAEIMAINHEYAVPAYSELASAVQVGPLMIDMSRRLRFTGDAADASYNNSVMQNALSGLPYGAELEFPERGYAYCQGGLVIDSASTHLRGANSGISYDQFTLKFTDSAQSAFRVKHSGLFVEHLHFLGAVPGRALNSTQDAFNFDVTLNSGHCDARFSYAGFSFWRAAHSITDSDGRNISSRDCSFSNSQYVLAVEYDSAPNDQRGFEYYTNRYHTMGRVGSATDSLFYIKATADVIGLTVVGGDADDCVRVMRGFSGMGRIVGLNSYKAAGAFADLDATGNALVGYGQFNIQSCGLMNVNGTGIGQFSGIRSAGPMYLSIDGFTCASTGGHGIEILSDDANISGAIVQNASMGLTNTYSGFYIGASANDVAIGGGSAYRHGTLPLGGTTAKFAVENLGTNTVFQDRLFVDGLTGAKAYSIDPTKTSRGFDPVVSAALRRMAEGAGPPVAGTWTLGDYVSNISSAGINAGWRCTVGGTPGTWVSV